MGIKSFSESAIDLLCETTFSCNELFRAEFFRS